MRIGMLYSLTGGQADMEKSILDGALLAVEEVNTAGGVGGDPVQVVIFDDESEVTLSMRGVHHLCRAEHADVIVGGYTSAARVAMLPAIHANESLLMYPTYFEGEESDPRVFYCGAAPNQYLANYLEWIAANLGRRLYIVGSDYIYPRVLAEAIRRLGPSWGIETVGESYVPMQETVFSSVVRDIARARPDVVVSNVVGVSSTTAFYTELYDAGFNAGTLPIAATVTTSVDLAQMPTEVSTGHFMVATYFSQVDNDANRRYRRALADRFGQHRSHAAQVGAYNAVHSVCLAAQIAPSLTPADLANALLQVQFDGNPEGVPFYFRSNHYSAHPSYVGQAEAGEYKVIAEFEPRPADPWWARRVSLAALG